MGKIFISYSRLNRDFAKRLANYLSQLGATIWMDEDDIPSGVKWDKAINESLRECAIMILILSPESMHSQNVEAEWQYFYDKQKPLIPILYRPLSDEDEHYQLRRYNHIDFVNQSFDEGFAKLTAELQKRGIVLNPGSFETQSDPKALTLSHSPSYTSQTLPSIQIMPAPFGWIDVPGKVASVWLHERFQIGKYPITNKQFEKFILADGYNQKHWWTVKGWEYRQRENWTNPLHWKDSKWNAAEQPVVGISWYEAIAFCLWLNQATGESITLPTTTQWQLAARGPNGWSYPWGNEWDPHRCNNNVDGKGHGKTTPVRRYEGLGDSPFGVVDMVGNVWELCLNGDDTNRDDISPEMDVRTLYGGAWKYSPVIMFRCDSQSKIKPYERNYYVGFRCVRSV